MSQIPWALLNLILLRKRNLGNNFLRFQPRPRRKATTFSCNGSSRNLSQIWTSLTHREISMMERSLNGRNKRMVERNTKHRVKWEVHNMHRWPRRIQEALKQKTFRWWPSQLVAKKKMNFRTLTQEELRCRWLIHPNKFSLLKTKGIRKTKPKASLKVKA